MKHHTKYAFIPPLFIWAILGFIVSLLIFEILNHWIPILAFFYGRPNLGYHELPLALHLLQWVLRYMLWAIVVILFVADMYKKDFRRVGGYSIGVILALIVELVLLCVRYSETMRDF